MSTLKNVITVFEYDSLTCEKNNSNPKNGIHFISRKAYDWLQNKCLNRSDTEKNIWIRRNPRRGPPTLQVLNHVGVIRTPCGLQIEVLPKIGRVNRDTEIGAVKDSEYKARSCLLKMVQCLYEFKKIKSNSAQLMLGEAPLLEIFIQQFLVAVKKVVQHGLRGNYTNHSDNLYCLRGKLIFSENLRHNLFRPDRFFTDHDQFTLDRPENRLIHSALLRVLRVSKTLINLKQGKELSFYFFEIPVTKNHHLDFQKVRRERGMDVYQEALIWARMILEDESPLTGHGEHYVPSFLWKMEALFEAYVREKLPNQLNTGHKLRTTVQVKYLVEHRRKEMLKMKPDYQIFKANEIICILDAKWKLLDEKLGNRRDKYKLSQYDFYQLRVYGVSYALPQNSFVVLIYPKTETFTKPLEVFQFTDKLNHNLWVLPFDIDQDKLELPELQQDSEENPAAKVLLNVFKE